jgi:hypothetical protein
MVVGFNLFLPFRLEDSEPLATLLSTATGEASHLAMVATARATGGHRSNGFAKVLPAPSLISESFASKGMAGNSACVRT